MDDTIALISLVEAWCEDMAACTGTEALLRMDDDLVFTYYK